MTSPLPTLLDPNVWSYFLLNGIPSPGSIPRGGFKGFKRETGWDEKKGKGTKGATLTLKTMPPCAGSITLQLIGPGGFYATGAPSVDFARWDYFVANALSIIPAKQQVQGLNVFHPQFQSICLTLVVVKSYTGPEHQGRGMYHATIELIEWSAPPPVSVVSTVTKVAPDADIAAGHTLSGQSSEEQQLQAAIAAATQATAP